ncbi:DUF2147 domain-containing protein [Salinivirga cyanobacteriivorans]
MKSLKIYHITIFIIVVLILTVSALKAQHADAILGKYLLPNGLKVKIFKIDNKYYGEITELEGFVNGEVYDVENPDESKREELLVGKVIIWNLVYDEQKNRWIEGRMYGPDKGITVDLEILEVNRNTILIEGSKYFFSKEMKWKRLN